MTWYKTGTVAVTPGSNAVLGTGTSFIANARVGDAFRGPDGEWYEVTNIASDTAVSIAPNYQGVAEVAGSYSLAPMQGYVKDSADALRAATQVIASGVADMQEQVAAATEAATSAGRSKTAATEQAGIATAAAEASTDNKDAAQLAAQQSQGSAQTSGAAAERSETARDSIIQSEQAAAASAAAAADSAEQAEAVTVGKAVSGDNNDITSLLALTADGFDRLRQGIPPMVGATPTVAGRKGLAPEPAPGDQDRFLTGSGVYKEVGGGMPVGSIQPWGVSRATLPAGWIARDGQLLSRADWPDLWALVSASAVTDAVWLASPHASRGKYSTGDGSTTFRMPDTNGKHSDGNTIAAMVLRGDGKNSAGTAGLHQQDQFQRWTFISPTSPTYKLSQLTNAYPNGGNSGTPYKGVYMAASPIGDMLAIVPGDDGVGGTPRMGTETRMSNETVTWCTVGAGRATNPGSVDVTALATSVSTQASQIATLDAALVFTYVYPNGGTEAAPASVSVNTRYSFSNPYPGKQVILRAQIQVAGVWEETGWLAAPSSASDTYGCKATLQGTDSIVVQTGGAGLAVGGNYDGGSRARGTATISTACPCRVAVWRVKG
ncbi:hypothetical protein PS683_03786 [Pseudomonas fluorescens]|uniref:Tail fiber protein n=1 Tax=Pseudomonas fluorescens TaxID=294 RepID=A0A5E6V3N3_PSEFL|nr:hypothetical protein PS683_03786 [Pseudomonas fluorescens]VVN09844.1 hypothetical protein PS683_03786 [Pseudomonas fluorescens]